MHHVSNTNMMCLSDLPLDIIQEIVDSLQDDLPTLKAGAQACLSCLLLSCKYIFRTITLNPGRQSMRLVTSLVDNNPRVEQDAWSTK